VACGDVAVTEDVRWGTVQSVQYSTVSTVQYSTVSTPAPDGCSPLLLQSAEVLPEDGAHLTQQLHQGVAEDLGECRLGVKGEGSRPAVRMSGGVEKIEPIRYYTISVECVCGWWLV